jgi:AraC-like DNA-binding protein
MDLLRKVEITFEEAGRLSGFASAAHLVRVFHRVRGVHPRDWHALLR